MSKPAAFQATYSDIRFIKTRKVCSVTLELPIEHGDAFVAAFGTPNPAKETWVAVARMDMDAAKEPAEKEKRPFADLPIAQQAALLCNRPAFWRFLCEHPDGNPHTNSDDAASNVLRRMCGVISRSELATNPRAAGKFQTLSIEFEQWLKTPL